jgi:hypothetical protein
MWERTNHIESASRWISDHNCIKENECSMKCMWSQRKNTYQWQSIKSDQSEWETYRDKHTSTLREMTEFCKQHLSTVKTIWQESKWFMKLQRQNCKLSHRD